MIEYPVKPKAISILTRIRQVIMEDDGNLALKIADCGKYVVGDMIADTIAAINRTEQQCCKALESLEMEREENTRYNILLGSRHPDDLTSDQKEELTELVAKWDAEEDEKCG